MVEAFGLKSSERYTPFFLGVTFSILFVLFGYTNSVYADSQAGKLIFKKRNCSLCHVVTRPGTEFKPMCPGLKGVSQLHSKDWVRRWLKNPAAVWKSNDEDVQSINTRYFEYRGSKPKPRESFMATVVGKNYILSDEEIEDLIDYLWSL
jgi:cytochrome c2